MVTFRCKQCRWFDQEHKSLEGVPSDLGYCRKHKPIVYGKDGRYYGASPLLTETDLCGEFKGEED